MNINDPARIFIDQCLRYFPQEAGKYYQGGLVVAELFQQQLLIKGLLIDNEKRYLFIFCYLQHTRIGLVAHYKRDLRLTLPFKITNNSGGIGARTRSEYYDGVHKQP